MCGIAGYFAFNTTRPTVEELSLLWQLLEARGQSAHGAAWLTTAGLDVYKAPGPISRGLDAIPWSCIQAAPSVLLHTRAATKGTPSDNRNNHPLHTTDVAIIHNGVILNDEHVCDTAGWIRQAEVDSEAILAAFAVESESSPKALKWLGQHARGSWAVGVLMAKARTLTITRNAGAPCYIVEDPTRELFWFASTADILGQLQLQWHGLRLKPRPLPTYMAYVAHPEGQVTTHNIMPEKSKLLTVPTTSTPAWTVRRTPGHTKVTTTPYSHEGPGRRTTLSIACARCNGTTYHAVVYPDHHAVCSWCLERIFIPKEDSPWH